MKIILNAVIVDESCVSIDRKTYLDLWENTMKRRYIVTANQTKPGGTPSYT